MKSVECVAASPVPFIDSVAHPFSHLFIQQTPSAAMLQPLS